MTTSQDIFIEIKDPQIRDKILSDLARHSMSVSVKLDRKSTRLYGLSPRSYSNLELACRGPADTLEKEFFDLLEKHQEIFLILQFNHYDDKYVTHVKFKFQVPMITLIFDEPLFRVQRRADFRLRLPRSLNAKIFLNTQQTGPQQSFQITDISAGGCRLEGSGEAPSKLQTHLVSQNNKSSANSLRAVIQIENHNEFNVDVEVRHLSANNGSKIFSAGLKFINLAEKDKNRIAALVMDLYRSLFKNRLDKE